MTAVEEPAVTGELPPLRKNRDFMLLWVGAGFTLLGARMTTFVYPLLVLWYTESASAAGWVGAATLLPQLLVQLPAGALVDRWDRRKVMIWSDAACVLLTASVAVPVFFDRVWVPQLVAVAFLQGAMAIFYDLAERAGVRNLVPAPQLPTALSQNEARSRAAQMLGQPLGGALFSVLRWTPFAATTLAHLASLFSLLFIRKKLQATTTTAPNALRRDIGEGLSWMWRQHFLRIAILLISVSNAVFPGLALCVTFIVQRSGTPAAVVGLVTAMGGVGGLLGALTGSWWRRVVSLRAVLIGSFLVWAVLTVPVAFVNSPFVLGACFAGFGYIGGLLNVAGGVYLVRVTPDAMMGRAVSVMTLLGSGTAFLGPLIVGPQLDRSGVMPTALGLAAVMGLLGVLALLSPSVWKVARTPEGARLSSRAQQPPQQESTVEDSEPTVRLSTSGLAHREIVWTEESREQIARHRVTEDEVEQIVCSRPRYTERVGEDATLVFGETTPGRMLLVVLVNAMDGRFHVATARPMKDVECRAFWRKGTWP
jgi:MFS family permease